MHTIRRLNVGEEAVYRSLRLEALKDSPEAFSATYESALKRDDDSWRVQADASAVGNDRATFVVLDGRPIGLAAVYRDPDMSSIGELIQMWVAPSHRGGVVATDLLNHLFRWTADRSFTSIRAGVTQGNLRALQFYKRYGFQPLSSESGDLLLTKPVEQSGASPLTSAVIDTALEIRDVTVEDAAAICDVLRRSITECCVADHNNNPGTISTWLANKTPENIAKWIHSPSAISVVAANRAGPVGFALSSGEALTLCYVVPEVLHQGVGKQLLAAVESRAVTQGITVLRLESTRTASSFYLRNGFILSGPVQRWAGMEGQPMVKQLLANPPA